MCDDTYSITQISGFEITAENVGEGITVLIGGGAKSDKFDKFDKSDKLDEVKTQTTLQFRSLNSINPALSYSISDNGQEIITDLILPDGLKPITGQNLNEYNNIYVEKITNDPLVDTLTFRNLSNSDGTKDINISGDSLEINENYIFSINDGSGTRSVSRLFGTLSPDTKKISFDFNKLFKKNYMYGYITELQIIKTDDSEGEMCSFIVSDLYDDSILIEYHDELNDTIITGIPYKGIAYLNITSSSDVQFSVILTVTIIEFPSERKMKNKGTLIIKNDTEIMTETKYISDIINIDEISCKSD